MTLAQALQVTALAMCQTSAVRMYAARQRDGLVTFYTRHTTGPVTWGPWTRTFGLPQSAMFGDQWVARTGGTDDHFDSVENPIP